MEVISGYFDKLAGAIMSFNFVSDLLDILLVAIVIYEGIKLLRGSRTFQLIKGIAFLAVIYLLVKVCQMEASEYLLSVLFENGLIILVVLFSPELRKILERFGKQSLKGFSLFNLKNNVDYEKTVNNTVNDFCKASADMSESKTGALVVFERADSLQEIAETGTIVDAQSSSELFNGLFFKNSALHDGAVIVREGRIYAAGCILPLTQNNSLDSELGTRHRAAIGMSEQGDAIVVVVSEETGKISVAKNGSLSRDVAHGELREILLGELLESNDKVKPSEKIKKIKKSKKGGDKNENKKA
ncbi:MAG: TIGR00159 family protein [Ruminococcaceae bacterium]|nr:TIGR00159 family protein [Oscillospiraceae bacterium]